MEKSEENLQSLFGPCIYMLMYLFPLWHIQQDTTTESVDFSCFKK